MSEIRVKSTGTIKLFESDNTSSVTIASPASLGGDRTITIPDADVDLTNVNSIPTLRPNVNPIIINGNMAVSQRSASVTGITATGYYTIDRYKFSDDSDAVLTFTQESLTSGNAYTDGFANAFKIDVTTADSSLSANQHALLSTAIEGQDLQVFKKGTSNAETITIAFWVKATKTGTSIFEIYDNDNSRQVSKPFTISSSNTWEKKVLNIPADTTGALGDDNAVSLYFQWYLCAGSNFQSGTLSETWTSPTSANRAVGQVNHFDSASNNFHITGVQIEVGTYTSATIPPFQHESYGNNLARCSRYFYKTSAVANMPFASGVVNGTTNARALLTYPQIMRANPSMNKSGNTDFKVYCGATNVTTTNVAFYYGYRKQVLLYADVASGLTNGQGAVIIDSSGSSYITGDSEL